MDQQRRVNLESDSVNHPSHYQSECGLEVLDVIYLFGLQDNFNICSALAYIMRAGKKGTRIEDLRKAVNFLNFEINEVDLIQRAKDKGTAIAQAMKGKDQNI